LTFLKTLVIIQKGVIMLTEPTSFDKLILETYQKEELKSEIISGWTTGPSQKTNIKGLKVLIQAILSDGRIIQPGSIAYLREEGLHNATVGRNKYKSDTLSCEFIVVNLTDVEYIVPPAGNAA
jgi:hypothetical protein